MTCPPIAIGGLGGSGTRVFAALLQVAGVHIGDCLNKSLDNLWFTTLFKRAAWAGLSDPTVPDSVDVATATRLFQRAMTAGLAGELSTSDLALLKRLRGDLLPQGTWHCGAQANHADDLMASVSRSGNPSQFWGWKEPNTHVFLRHLDQQIPGFRYIHVVRDGLDMAFSNNTWQARHWAHLYGIKLISGAPVPPHQLRYWSAANRVAINYGSSKMPGRFLVVHYEDFCTRPAAHWFRILRFLGLPEDQPLPEDLVRPSTIGRSSAFDLSEFPDTDLAEARALQDKIIQIGRPG